MSTCKTEILRLYRLDKKLSEKLKVGCKMLQTRLLSSIILACFMLFCFVPPQLAQMTTGTISGVVSDAQGAVVPGVTIKVNNEGTGIARETVTDGQGHYRIPELPVGTYTIEAEFAGLQTQERTGLSLAVGSEAVVNLQMQVGSVAQNVSVQAAEVQLVPTTSSTISALVDEQTMRDLPLNGRNYTSLVALQPNVMPNILTLGGMATGNGVGFIVQGQGSASNLFLL